MTRPLLTIDEALREAGFTLTQTENLAHIQGHTYRHPQTHATCYILIRDTGDLIDLSKLRLKAIDMEQDAHLRLDLTNLTGNCTIEYLKVAGTSQLTLTHPFTFAVENLELRNSQLLHLKLIQEGPLYSLRLVDSYCHHLTIESSVDEPNHEVALDETHLDAIYLESTVQTLENCYLSGPYRNQPLRINSTALQWTLVNLQSITLHCFNASSGAPIFVLPNNPTCGSMANLNGHTIRYALLVDKHRNRYLQLGCWLGTLKDALRLINRDCTEWPSYSSFRDYTEDEMRAARKRYQHLIRMLQLTPVGHP